MGRGLGTVLVDVVSAALDVGARIYHLPLDPARMALVFGLLAFLPTGCVQELDARSQRDLLAAHERTAAGERIPDLHGPLTLAEVIGIALRYNLEHELEARRALLADREARKALLQTLPSIHASAEGGRRGEYPAREFRDAETDDTLFTAYDRDRAIGIGEMELVFNALDFGLSYIRWKQGKERAAQAMQEMRRARQNLVLAVTKAYWRVQRARDAVAMRQSLRERMEDLRRQLRDAKAVAGLDKGVVLDARRELLRREMELRRADTELEEAKLALSRLMGLPLEVNYALAPPALGGPVLPEPRIVADLEGEALRRRPELYVEDRRTEIARREIHAAMLRFLPSPAAYLRGTADGDKLLENGGWWTFGVRASTDLLSLPAKYMAAENARLAFASASDQRLAVAIGVIAQVHVALARRRAAVRAHGYALAYHELQEEALRHAQDQVRNGEGSQTDVLKAEADALLAHGRLLHAYGEVKIAEAVLDNALGRDTETVTVVEEPTTVRIDRSLPPITPDCAIGPVQARYPAQRGPTPHAGARNADAFRLAGQEGGNPLVGWGGL